MICRVVLAACLIVPVASAAPDSPKFIRLIDINGDRHLDRLSNGADGEIAVALGLGHRKFERIEQVLPSARISALLNVDLNGDGRMDLYLITPHANLALLGNGAGKFIESTERQGLLDEGFGINADWKDIDDDGSFDLLLHNREGDVLFWGASGGFDRDESTPFVSVGLPSGTNPVTLAPTNEVQGSSYSAPKMTALEEMVFGHHLSIVQLPDGVGGTVKTLRITGLNVQIVNGLEATNGNPDFPDSLSSTTTNGAGNLIVGYNELGNPKGDDRTGSHNLVIGHGNSYTKYGGIVAAEDNTIEGAFASVIAGSGNFARSTHSSISGGQFNSATASWSSVSGGERNVANGNHSSVSGGQYNSALSSNTSISGGCSNYANGTHASILGGESNTTSARGTTISGGRSGKAIGRHSSVSGGFVNTAYGRYSTVGGGEYNNADGGFSSISGGRGNTASGSASSVSGGQDNFASGNYASISGGRARNASGPHDWSAGSLAEDE